jgi:REP element-mobilizing transposase RayT
MSRTVNGERLFDDVAMEMLRRQIWKVADYCGVQILTYAILSNHFHVLVRVPQAKPVSDTELLRRYRALYPKPTVFQPARVEVIEGELARNDASADAWRQRQLAQMGDVSQFMKLLKQRFSTWYNNTHERFGTLWAERFKSVLVEPAERVLQTMTAYIDLNCVRAGLVTDPLNYRFCGYAEAVAGNLLAQKGIQSAIGGDDWTTAQSRYRETLFGTAAAPREAAASLTTEDLQRVISEGGKLPMAVVLRCRLRYFTDGAALGSMVFVAAQLARFGKDATDRRPAQPRKLPPATDWGDLVLMRRLRGTALG